MHPTEDDFRLIPETPHYLSTRTINTLRRNGHNTAEQIMLATSEQLMSMKGFGYRGLGEIAAWRDALMQKDPVLFTATLEAVVGAMQTTESIVSEKLARAAMRCIWNRIATGPFTASRIRQMLIDPTTDQ
jgi:hypothetical protein